MDLLDLLSPEHGIVLLDAPDLRIAIESLVQRLEQIGAVGLSDHLRARIRTEPLGDGVAISDDPALPRDRSDA